MKKLTVLKVKYLRIHQQMLMCKLILVEIKKSEVKNFGLYFMSNYFYANT